jgi:hypothetical protein
MLIATVALLSALFAILPLHRRVAKLWDRAPIPMQFVYTVVATALGVYLSIHAMDLQKQASDLEEARSRLERIEAVLEDRLRIYLHAKPLVQQAKTETDRLGLLAALDTSFVRVLLSGGPTASQYSHDFVALSASLTGILDARLGMSLERTAQSDETMEEYLDFFFGSVSRLLVASAIEHEFLDSKLAQKDLAVLYRCALDAVRTPSTEKGYDASDCPEARRGIDDRIPKRLNAKLGNLREKYGIK